MLTLLLTFVLVAQATTYDMITRPWAVTASEPVKLGYLDFETGGASFGIGICLDPDECPAPRDTGIHSSVVAYNSSGQIVDFLNGDGEPFMQCAQEHVPELDIDKYMLIMLFVPDPVNGGVHWPGVNGADGWPHKVACIVTNGTDTARSETLLKPRALAVIPETTINLVTGYVISLPGNAWEDVASISVKQKLPSGTYTTGLVHAKTSPTQQWDGVRAVIEEGGASDYITYMISQNADENAGPGYFTIVKNGTAVQSPFSFTRP